MGFAHPFIGAQGDLVMGPLFVQRRVQIPMVGTWKWKPDDYKVPLVFHLSGCRCLLFLDPYEPGKREREITWDALVRFEFPNPPATLLKGLKTSGKLAVQAAELIYGLYVQVHEQFESILRTAANMVNLMRESPMRFEAFFEEETISDSGVLWWHDGEEPKPFRLKIARDRRRVNPLFKHDHILTMSKWKRLQTALENREFPSAELLELLRIRARLMWREKKIATVESAILVESILREYAVMVLTQLGFSKNKLKALQDDLNFNTVLNAILPLSLSRAEARKMARHIEVVDVLRKVRNDVVHGNIREEDIDESSVRKGIDAALRLVQIIKGKLPRP